MSSLCMFMDNCSIEFRVNSKFRLSAMSKVTNDIRIKNTQYIICHEWLAPITNGMFMFHVWLYTIVSPSYDMAN